VLRLCRDEEVQGWIIDEQDDGVGMAMGAEDAVTVAGHRGCCIGQSVELWLPGEEPPEAPRPTPMLLVHATPIDKGIARVGLAFDVARMQPEDIVHLLGVWRRLVFGATD
jgi:hypothetical protein